MRSKVFLDYKLKQTKENSKIFPSLFEYFSEIWYEVFGCHTVIRNGIKDCLLFYGE